MTVTEEELQKIVAHAVKVALGEIIGEGHDVLENEPRPNTNPVEIKSFGEAELNDAMNVFDKPRG